MHLAAPCRCVSVLTNLLVRRMARLLNVPALQQQMPLLKLALPGSKLTLKDAKSENLRVVDVMLQPHAKISGEISPQSACMPNVEIEGKQQVHL